MNPLSESSLMTIDGLQFRYRKHHALDISKLSLERGEFVLLSGANGSGKTTLLKILAGLLCAHAGHFTCLGTGMQAREAQRFCRGRHIYLHQTPYMFDATVADNVAYGLKLRGRDTEQRQVEIADALGWADLAHLSKRHAAELSTGEKQRVALTRARILAPSVLLLDEITANMDSASRSRTLQMINDLKRAGSSVVFATHDSELLETACDRHLELAGGTIVAGNPKDSNVVPLNREKPQP